MIIVKAEGKNRKRELTRQKKIREWYVETHGRKNEGKERETWIL